MGMGAGGGGGGSGCADATYGTRCRPDSIRGGNSVTLGRLCPEAVIPLAPLTPMSPLAVDRIIILIICI